MADFKIVMTGHGRGEVFMDGVKVSGVCGIEFRANAHNGLNTVKLTYIAGSVVIDGDAVNVTALDSGDYQVWAKAPSDGEPRDG